MKIKLVKIIFYFILLIIILISFKNNINITSENFNNILNKKFYFNNYFQNITNIYDYFSLIEIKYLYSLKFRLVHVKYKIGFFDMNNNLILPSDIALYKNLHIICNIIMTNYNIEINSFPNINNNRYFECNEFYKINKKVKFGIKIYTRTEKNDKIQDYIIYFFSEKIFNFNILLYKKNEVFDPFILIKEYQSLKKRMEDNEINKNLKLKNLYSQFPLCKLKDNLYTKENIWYFQNIYNYYFCFCKGIECFIQNNFQKCKYLFYLNILDNNRNIYNKTDYLFIDFIFNEYSSDDAYPVFKRMISQKEPVHYLTENIDIYNKYCLHIQKCLTIIYVNKNNYTINGDFLEKHLTLILKLKEVLSGGGVDINYINNLFYNLEFITYICIGHGISFFKSFLYDYYDCYGSKRYNKILIPPSDKLINVAKNFGWKDNDIIKINLPRWDKYNNYNNNLDDKEKKNSIFIMFTWRDINKDKNISSYYFKNIILLVNNIKLNNSLKKNKIILYFTLHHKLFEYKYKFKINQYIKYIEENEISECLSKIKLLVSDFSSIIFDLIYQRKPFIIYIPDANDPEIELNYKPNYYQLIQSLKNETIYFKNKFFEIEKVVNKILYYINNNFSLEPELEMFYNSFHLYRENNTNKFITYISKII